MALLGNDVLVCGGWDALTRYLSSCDLYNASINEWAAAATIPPLPIAMIRFPMITLHTRPYVFGGWMGNDVVNTVYTFNTSNAWATRTPMERAVESHTAVALYADTALLCGGFDGLDLLSACYSYAAAKDVWSPAAQIITARRGHGMAVYKGRFVADYDLHKLQSVHTGRVFVYGGWGRTSNGYGSVSSVEMLSIDGQTWATLPTPMFEAEYYFASVALP